jgi:prolipoprotein diacylglyceryltransferase
MPGIRDEHNRVLPQPVFPTPLYETIICSLLFLLMWTMRRSIKTPLVMFGFYLFLNGAERFFIERIRVNIGYNYAGFITTQAELIAIILAIAGVVLMIVAKKWGSEKK